MSRFDEIKQLLMKSSLGARACVDGFRELKGSENIDDLSKVGVKHFFFAVENGILTPDVVREINHPDFRVNEDVTDGFVIVTEDFGVTASGNSFAVVLNGELDARDNTQVLALGGITNSWDDSLVTAKNESEVNAKGFSKVYALDNSKVYAEYNSYIIKRSDSAEVTRIDETATIVERLLKDE